MQKLQASYRSSESGLWLHVHVILNTRERFPIVSAEGLAEHDVFRLYDPFAVITVDLVQRCVTSMIEKTIPKLL